ncbi:CDP-diacylglycerol--glycerol-3-phosphate 3-phosphatidyltransferase [Bifidobacterium gallicum]|uniref:CDP-diacylglycerol--glycerol-3-phosphate 3-phosphatidyltransferase n=1 Tax=Bifidobacterium gallicum DSM 20093 = LMG 11596 TaxID=561180 RepID=D1NT62_9BIFI|nr:CDP-diacylglycerol--glycerol-3-phosphate 3-phosphatidyltransferase [Bifidobacterium gallicum]EFA23864.1 CDP-diacylglycerol--glycerol-3-phosphate 3-phosphatidyltransferase [Bifidobacterium gallicum DSM 20093 = LMG 11596]KFI59148.1 CDP-diacylglycerol--glycerol-3-phosphate 3-phosphatidyltransferase [Bifidobacterium gallicum DSM 20093 = LMG 11596]
MQQTDTAEKRSLWDGWNAPPNLVTFSRIILVVVFLILYIAGGPWGSHNMALRWWAGVIFIIAASTDKIDGWMARKYNQVTELGKLLDPIADKLLTLGALVVAACFNEFGNPILGWVVTLLFAVRELGITIMRFFVIEEGGKVIAASQAGKYKTLTQCIGLGMLMLPVWSLAGTGQPVWLNIYLVIMYALIYFSLILCLYSGWEYLSNTFGWGTKRQ